MHRFWWSQLVHVHRRDHAAEHSSNSPSCTTQPATAPCQVLEVFGKSRGTPRTVRRALASPLKTPTGCHHLHIATAAAAAAHHDLGLFAHKMSPFFPQLVETRGAILISLRRDIANLQQQ